MKIIVLGSGTSTGVPVPGCNCKICSSSDPKDCRLRTSLALQFFDEASAFERTVLIDTTTDFRQQALRAGIKRVDAVFYTHAHADHIFGFDDLRGFGFIADEAIPIYAEADTARQLRTIFNYVFEPDPDYIGGGVPRVALNIINPGERFDLYGISVTPLRLMHGPLSILGFRINDLAYLTDCSAIPDDSRAQLQGLKVLIIDGLRIQPHPTHFNHDQALIEIEKLRPAKSFLTHLSHEILHVDSDLRLKEKTDLDVSTAYDGLSFEI